MTASSQQQENQPGYVSPELDRMSCDMMGEFLDALAGDEACLNAADDFVVSAGRNGSPEDGVGPAVRYAILYLGCIQEMDGAYNDAMITVFGEKGSASAYSAFTLVKGMGQGENFMWSDPEPAGEEQLLL